MLYSLYLYGTTAATGNAAAVHIVKNALGNYSEKEWKGNRAASFMRPFDTAHIVQCIQKALTDPVTGHCKCRAEVRYPPKAYDQIGYLYIATSYEKAAQVLPRLHAIAAENDLVLYDAETGRTFCMDLIDHTYITMQIRRRSFLNAIRREMKPVWKVRRLEFVSEERDKWCAYAVTLRKDQEHSFPERNARFFACLQNNLAENEKLVCEDQCYRIVGQWYSITFVLEGYKKHPDYIGYADRNELQVSVPGRMSVDEAYRWMEGCTDREKEDIWARMRVLEMRDKYPNPAQRFVESVNITKWQRKQIFDIRYSGFGYYGSEILFHVVPSGYYNNTDEISVLKIEEESASFLLAFIQDVYPDFGERYYMDKNHIPSQLWERILVRLREAKEWVLHDTFGTALRPYIERFHLYALLDRDGWENAWRIKEEPVQFLYERRYRVAELFDVFLRWSEAQLRTHAYIGGLMFNIQGP